ncbi:helix-turn-helix transcriptional regulator [Gemmobacter caeruleus]|uniref:helix-turn-helix transcriptional regulator n=1 Tax=Gemmobacter caeruleus TaxID=2595004 RepID=UPI0011ED8B22|nr:WYL domain-containing protein [Gemmobacter caeruleus]
MSFHKAQELLKLAQMAASRYRGISLPEISEEFGVNTRTAQRMVRALENTFPSISIQTDSDRRRWWKLRDASLIGKQGIYQRELVALEMSIRRAEREGAKSEVEALQALRDRLMATLPSSHARRAEVDAEAVLEAQGYACRPGPKVKTSPLVTGAIAEALKAPFSLIIRYQGKQDAEPRDRTVEPYGVLLGTRHYLIARDPTNGPGFRRFRLDRIIDARITGQAFVREKDFDLDAYAAQSFGSYHSDAEFGQVVWRFSPAAASTAREFLFHPGQVMTDQADGGLLVTFRASGWVEMAWHLYQWGDMVAVIEPNELRDMAARCTQRTGGTLP